MLSTKNYNEVNNMFTELTSEEAADVNGGGKWGAIIGAIVGGVLGGIFGGGFVGFVVGVGAGTALGQKV